VPIAVLNANEIEVEVLTLDDVVGPAGTASTNVQTVQGIAGMTPVQTTVGGSLPAGTNNIGDVDIASIAAGDNNIGNVDVVTLPSIPAGTNNIGDVDVLSLPATPAGTNLIGRVSGSDETSTVYNATTALTPKFAVIAASSSGANAIVTAVTGKKIRVLAYNFMASGAVNAKWQSASTDKSGLKYLAANTGIVAGYNKVGWLETASDEALNLNLSGAVAVGGELVYVEV
jgi:hypothetical protein